MDEANDDRHLGKVKRMDGCLKVYKKLSGSGKKEWCTLGNFDLKCTHKATSVGDKGPAQYVFTATVLPEDATAHGPFYIVVSKEDFDRNDIIVAKIQAARPGSGGYIKEGMSKSACLSSFIDCEISKLEEDIADRAVEHPDSERQPAIVFKSGGYVYFSYGGEKQVIYVVGRNCTLPLTSKANKALALYTGNLSSENQKEYILPDWTVSQSDQFDGQEFLNKLKVAFKESIWPLIALFGNTLLSIQKEALYEHKTIKPIKVGAVHLVGPSAAHKSTLYNHFRWTLPQEGLGPVRIDKMSVASLKVETGRWCRFPVGQDPCEDQPGKVKELLTLLDRLYEGSNEVSYNDLGRDKKCTIPSNIHLVWQGEMEDLSHLDVSRLTKDLFLFMEELQDCDEDIDEILDELKEKFSGDASSLFKHYVLPLDVTELWEKVKATKKSFSNALKEDISERLVKKYNRVVESYALNYEASLEFLKRAKLDVDRKGLEAYFLQKCIPKVMKKICVALNKDMPCSSEITHEHLAMQISEVGNESILQSMTFVTCQDKHNQKLAFSAKVYRDHRLRKLFPAAQVNSRCRFVSPMNPKEMIWFMHKQNVDLYGSKSCQGKGYLLTEEECPEIIKTAFVNCLKHVVIGIEECVTFMEMRSLLDKHLLASKDNTEDPLGHGELSNVFSTTKMQFLTLSNEEQKLFIEWANSRDVYEDQSIEEAMDEGSDLTNTFLSIDGSGMDVVDSKLV